MIRLLTLILLIAGSFLFFSCDAPRLNPLDPQGSVYNLGQLDGFVFSDTRIALSDVYVSINNQTLSTKTDSKGYYKVSGLTLKNGVIYFEKPGYKKDSLSINWNGQKQIRLDEKVLITTIGQLRGYIYSYPRIALPGVRVTWRNQSITVVTDSKGYYEFNELPMIDGKIYIEKDGFKKDSTDVIWNNRKSILLEDKTLDYTTGQIQGRVRKASYLQTPIPGVKILWKNLNIITVTDNHGNFILNNIPFENGWLYFECNSFSNDSTYVDFSGQRGELKQIGDLFLNSLPKLNENEFKIYSSVENSFPDIKVFRIEVRASITDEEGDIDSVFIKCDQLNFSKPLTYNITTKYFEARFTTTDIKISSMEEAIGKNFYIIVKDINGKIFNVGFSNIKRIINDYVQIKSPANEKIVSSLPTFEWERFQPGFNFKYYVQVYTRETVPAVVWSQEGISKDDTQTITNIALRNGDYFWVIWCVDDFGNRARSTLGTFSVR